VSNRSTTLFQERTSDFSIQILELSIRKKNTLLQFSEKRTAHVSLVFFLSWIFPFISTTSFGLRPSVGSTSFTGWRFFVIYIFLKYKIFKLNSQNDAK